MEEKTMTEEERSFKERCVRSAALAQGENPDDPEVMARYTAEWEAEHPEEDVEEEICTPQQLSVMFKKLCVVMNQLEGRIVKPKRYGNMTLEDLLANQAINFALDLAAADGVLAKTEADVLNEIFGFDYTSADYAEIWKQRDESCFMKGVMRNYFVPSAYYVAVAADNGMYGGKEVCTVAVLKFFAELAKLMIAVDGEIDEEEAKSLSVFLAALQTMEQNGSNGFVFVQNTDDVRL